MFPSRINISEITIFTRASMFCLCVAVDPAQVGKGIALITVMDVNDNAPVFAIEYETFVCETAQPGQVLTSTAL